MFANSSDFDFYIPTLIYFIGFAGSSSSYAIIEVTILVATDSGFNLIVKILL